MNEQKMREEFKAWYVDAANDGGDELEGLTSRRCGLQWAAWKARQKEIDALQLELDNWKIVAENWRVKAVDWSRKNAELEARLREQHQN